MLEVQLIGWGIRTAVRRVNAYTRNEADREFYKRQRLPVFAPPGIAFPICMEHQQCDCHAGALHVLNTKRNNRERHWFLCLQTVACALFVTFNTAYFELRSPISAAQSRWADNPAKRPFEHFIHHSKSAPYSKLKIVEKFDSRRLHQYII
jgi:tryptophan-rich sensory protein